MFKKLKSKKKTEEKSIQSITGLATTTHHKRAPARTIRHSIYTFTRLSIWAFFSYLPRSLQTGKPNNQPVFRFLSWVEKRGVKKRGNIQGYIKNDKTQSQKQNQPVGKTTEQDKDNFIILFAPWLLQISAKKKVQIRVVSSSPVNLIQTDHWSTTNRAWPD